ncbi:hypothetical protein KSC_023900 [Ktedonobacter sp. SOSP1-52]|nr:hypothetical protein KSC_023900 [Ktedonobacter sp. SOSP1-52]
MIIRRTSPTVFSEPGEQILTRYEQRLRVEEDLARATFRNYLSDLRHFAACCEFVWKQGREAEPSFAPEVVTTSTVARINKFLFSDSYKFS